MKLIYHFIRVELFVFFVVIFQRVHGFYENQAKFISENGHLVIESALHRNITFRMKGVGYVNVNGINLLQILQTNTRDPRYDDSSRVNRRLSTIERKINGPNGVSQRLQRLENNNSTQYAPNSNKIRQLNTKVQRLEETVATILRKLSEDNCRSYPCQNGGECISRYEGFTCKCRNNWEGVTCSQDVNECANFAGTDLGCQNGATCINTHGSYNCLCNSGWQGLHCTRKTTDCLSGSSGDLCGHGTCVQTNTPVGYTCICEQGWTTNGVTPACSVDVNECLDSKPHCSRDPLVTCINLPGSFMCGQCPMGFIGNGFYCSDINECETNNGGCSTAPSVSCINERGSYRCGSCPNGYDGDGKTCIRTGNSCSRANFCHPQARCVEYPNSAVLCICPEGYTGNGLGPNGCTRTDSCSPNPCLNGGTCIANGFGWTCNCPPQTSGSNCVRNADLCTPNPCLNGGTCIQTESRRRCSCVLGYLGIVCQTQQRACGGRLNTPSGTLKYPVEGSSTYQHNARCVWLIETNNTQVLNITFTEFHLENSNDCRFDWLQIHDGRSSASYMIGRFCGATLPNGGNIQSTHNMLYLWFRSDNSTSHSGFTLNWQSVEPICGGVIQTSTFGTIASPGSPGNYPPNRDCIWRLFAPRGKRIQLHFYTMKLEMHSTCDKDFLAIYEGVADNGVLLEKFCNTTQPDPFLSPANGLTLNFHSDGDSTDTGFQIHYSIVEGIPGCGGTFTSPKGEFSSPMENEQYQHNLECEYVIKMPVNVRINIEFRQFELEEHSECRFDYVAVYEGRTEEGQLVSKYCGFEIPPSYTSESNILMIKFKTDSSTAHSGFRIYYTNVCGGKFFEEPGIITSPNYPLSYESDSHCQYYIEAPVGKGISLDFIDFDLESTSRSDCSYDYVQVFDGINLNVSSIGKFCGRQIPERIIATLNYLLLEFVTDSTVSGRGFKANYTFFDSTCGGILKSSDTVIRPPATTNPEDGYEHGSYCTWVIVAPPGKVIQLTWVTFDIEEEARCSYDYVEIYDNSTNYGGLIGKFCGQRQPPTFTSSDNIITIIFKSDLSRNTGGFSATFEFVDASRSCGKKFYSPTGVLRSPGFPKGYGSRKSCEWIISVPTGQQIELLPKTFELESHSECNYDYLEIRNGGNSDSPLYGKFCGSIIPEHLTSFGNEIYLKFVTDHSNNYKGFEIEWDGTATGCGGMLTTHTGLITSPNYPNPYGENSVCIWRISVSMGSTIKIIISDIEMEGTSSCIFDYLEIFDGRETSSRSLGRFCSDNHPLEINSTGNHVYLRMQTDHSNQERGFSLRYMTVCHTEITGHMGVIESPEFPGNYPPSMDCEWTVRATKGNKIFMEFSHFDVENRNDDICRFDYVEIREVDGSREASSRKYCNHAPANFTSQFEVVVVKFITDRSVPGNGFRLEWKVEGCGDLLTRPEGTFTSPNYPSAYPRNTHCEWTIKSEYGLSVELTIGSFAMESSDNCHLDGLFISNGRDSSQILTSLCNAKTTPTVITGQGNEMFIKFYSDGTASNRGFSATYKFVESKCGGILTISNGFIYSPNYPNNYDVDIVCEWLIKIENNHLIELNVMDFDIEDSNNCVHDKLMIYDGPENNEEKLLNTLCGNQMPNETKYLSSGNEMLLKFTTDDTIQAKGFKLNYTVTCGARIITNDTGILTLSEDLKNNFNNCTWTIEATQPSQHVTLTITHLDLDEESNVDDRCKINLDIYDGDNLQSPKKGSYCGIKHPIPIISSGQFLTVNLYTRETRGFKLTNMHFTAHYSVYDNACGGTFTSEHGTFATPHYPRSYPLNVECVWNIVASPGNRIGINLQSLNIPQTDNCHDSYLEIREIQADGKLVGTYCGSNSALNLTSSSGYWIKFRSGDLETGSGFIADYFYDPHNELSGPLGKISSPLYPHYLISGDKIYTWRLSVEFGSLITITFEEFGIGQTSDCNSLLKIYDGYDENAPSLTEDLCGSDIPDPATSSSNVLYFRLRKTRDTKRNRFLINWKSIDKTSMAGKNESNLICGDTTIVLSQLNDTVNFTSPGYPYGYGSNINCSWIIISNLTTHHPSLNMKEIDLEDMENCLADYIEIFTSDDLSTWKKLDKRCSFDSEKNNIYHGSPYLRIDFRSDFSVNKTGFRGLLKLQCGSFLKGSTGMIKMIMNDESYIYQPDRFCTWNITVRRGRTIKFNFESLALPMTHDDRCGSSIILRNGIDEDSPLLGIGKYCGTTISEINQTSSNRASVKFNMGSERPLEFILRYQEMSPECGESVILTKNVNSTIISSPNYPNVPYPHSECIWIIMAPAGENLKFEFLETFDLQFSKNCESEYVEINDGSTSRSNIIGKYCGTKPAPYISSNNILRFKFFTDVSEPNNGFKVKISIALCGAVYRSNKGIISSPNYPALGAYPPNSLCEYHIVGKLRSSLNLTFINIDLPEGNCSESDYIQILSLLPDQSRNVTENDLGRFCGSNLPPPILAEGNEVKIRFKTFALQHLGGFQIAYNSSEIICGGDITGESGILTSPGYPSKRQLRRYCVWKITVPKGRRITVNIIDVDLSPIGYSAVLFYNDHEYSNRFASIKFGDTLKPISSTDNKMKIYFYSGGSNHRGLKLTYSSNESTICEGDLKKLTGSISNPVNITSFSCEYLRESIPFSVQQNIGTMTLEFTDMAVGNKSQRACSYSSGKIAVTSDSNELAIFCGNSTKTATIRSPFIDTKITASRNDYSGPVIFNLAYKVHECGGILHNHLEEFIRQPNFTESYGKVDCAWQVKYNEESRVNLLFRNLNFKLSCDKEYINIYNGPSPKSPKIGTYCEGRQENIVGNSHLLFIEYHTDVYNRDSSFELKLTPTLTACGGILTRTSFNFGIPATNSQYPNNIECIWEIHVSQGYHIGLFFTGRFYIEQSVNCSKDYVEVSDNVNNSWKFLGRFCGREIPSALNSTGTKMKLVFRSDSAISGDGFNATWEENCGGTFIAHANTRIISSPGFPEHYESLMSCNYTILAPENSFISLKFLDFVIEGYNDCKFDNVTIYTPKKYSMNPNEMEEAGVFCKTKPDDLRIKNKINIVFKSDISVNLDGFQFEYALDQCGGIITESSIIESPKTSGSDVYAPHLMCYWNISAPIGKKISIRFETLHLEHNGHCSYDYIEVYADNETVIDKRLAKLCGNLKEHLPTINVDSNQAIVHFRTDSSNHFGGFSALVIFSEMCNKKVDLTDASPNFVLNEIHTTYAPLLDCHYFVAAPIGRSIKISFDQFHLASCAATYNKSGCACDFLEIRDGEGPFADLIGIYCGQTTPPVLTSSGSALWIRFATDSTLSSTGFIASMSLHESACGPNMITISKDQTKIIQSQGDGTYLPNIRCVWTVTAADDEVIEIDFQKLDLQAAGDYGECSNDMLQITDERVKPFISEGLGRDTIFSGKAGSSRNSFYTGIRGPITHNQYCGQGQPQPFISSSNVVHIKFQTDSEIEATGFKLEAKVLHSCDRNFTSTQGRIVASSAKECSFWITAPENYTLSLYFISLYFSESNCDGNGMKIYENGPNGRLISNVCGYALPDPIFATTKSLYIKIQQPDDHHGSYDFYYLASDQGPGCGGQIFNYGGIFSSPMYPQNDRNFSDCRWDISVPQNLKVSLRFSMFDLGSHILCDSNFVEIIEINQNTQIQTVARKYCGEESPATYRGNRNILSVRFKKTVNFSGTGFIAQFVGTHDDTEIHDW